MALSICLALLSSGPLSSISIASIIFIISFRLLVSSECTLYLLLKVIRLKFTLSLAKPLLVINEFTNAVFISSNFPLLSIDFDTSNTMAISFFLILLLSSKVKSSPSTS